MTSHDPCRRSIPDAIDISQTIALARTCLHHTKYDYNIIMVIMVKDYPSFVAEV